MNQKLNKDGEDYIRWITNDKLGKKLPIFPRWFVHDVAPLTSFTLIIQ